MSLPTKASTTSLRFVTTPGRVARYTQGIRTDCIIVLKTPRRYTVLRKNGSGHFARCATIFARIYATFLSHHDRWTEKASVVCVRAQLRSESDAGSHSPKTCGRPL